MKHVYLAHRLGMESDREQNRQRATRWALWIAEQRIVPACSWVVLTAMMAETPETRELGLSIDKAQISRCDEVWLCGDIVSPGMKEEMDYAHSMGITVVDVMTKHGEPPTDGIVKRIVVPPPLS